MDKKHFEVKTYFKIIGDFNPEEITDLLGIIPDKQWKIGDIRYKINDKTSVYDFALWQTGLVKTVNEYYVEKQMSETISKLEPKIDILKKIKERYNVNFTLEVVPTFYSAKDKPILSPNEKIIAFCYQTKTNIDYDYYFCFNSEC